jgi:NAD(P)-dependent dehydrogenase (short-subunit alcohol dehydrogenase family)
MALLDGQIALVVGAGGGIGAAVVRRYVREGARVVAVDRDAERLGRLASELPAIAAPSVVTLVADASTWDGSRAMVARALAAFGGHLDVLVSTTGVYDHAVRLVDVPGERLEAAAAEAFRVNVTSMLLNVRAAVPHLLARRGRIVLTASHASFLPAGGGVLYTAAKHAVAGVVRQLAYELAPKIRVNGVAPGVAPTVMSGLATLDQPPRPSLLPGTEDILPLGRVPDPDEYGALYALLGSTESGPMTGSIVHADSGLAIRGIARPAGGTDL